MKLSHLLARLTQFIRFGDREVYVVEFVRDKDGCVVSYTRTPVAECFSHRPDKVEIWIERAESRAHLGSPPN